METTLLWVIAAAILAVIYGVVQTASLLKAPAGNERMGEIARAIQEGAGAYLKRQYTTIAIVGVVILAAVFLLLGLTAAIGFLIGAVLSGLAGYAGMLISVRANVRTAQAASESLAKGLSLAFRSGAVTGMFVAGFALFGVAGYFAVLTGPLDLSIDDATDSREIIDALVSLGFGASLISIFARLGGGIFTKGADVGGDMVGKVEAGIPEDDPRNAATIADNVGDNVGDCAGMAADLFETYAVTTVATMVLAAIFFRDSDVVGTMMLLPLAICGVCIVTSILGAFAVRLPRNNNIMQALYQGLIATGVLSIGAVAAVIYFMVPDSVTDVAGRVITDNQLFICGLIGLAVTAAIVIITEFYTGWISARALHRQGLGSGHGTNVIQGLAVSLEATAAPALAIIVGIIASYELAGCSASPSPPPPCLSLAGMIVALDAFGRSRTTPAASPRWPGLPPKSRVHRRAGRGGQHHQGGHQGLRHRSAGLGALVLFAAYTQDLRYFAENALEYPSSPGWATSPSTSPTPTSWWGSSSGACCRSCSGA
jgi:K(+)-stimulated pyrophosphate-energized sodium pump